MEYHRGASSTGESDDDPDENNITGPSSEKAHKARVRFNSATGARPPQFPSATSFVQAYAAPRPQSILRGISRESVPTTKTYDEMPISPKDAAAATEAQSRAREMARKLKANTRSTSISDLSSIDSVTHLDSQQSDRELLSQTQDIALQTWSRDRQHSSSEQSEKRSNDVYYQTVQDGSPPLRNSDPGNGIDVSWDSPEKKQKEELEEIFNGSVDGSYNVPPPEQYRGGVLSQLLKLQKQSESPSSRNPGAWSPKTRKYDHRRTNSQPGTGATTPDRRRWYEQNESQDTLATLIQASTKLAKPAQPTGDDRPAPPRTHKSTNSLGTRLSQFWNQEEAHVKVHIAGTLARHDFIVKLCRALMLYGAPTHRLEEYLTMTARALEVQAQFLYIPGCMLIAFDDATTHTTEVKLVRLAQGIDLGRLKDVHRIYKEVIHDVIGVEDATTQLEEFMAKKPKFHPWFRVVIFGLTSVTASPFSFHARPIDLPICFFFGCLVGALQLIVAPKLPLYSNVFEVSATVLVSFLARAFGSIRGGNLFCFSALAQGGIVMLLPGYMFLSSSLELQAKAIVPGSIRIVYGVIYCLLLGFGITVGAALYGLADSNATSALQCTAPLDPLLTLPFVPPFVLCIAILYQAKWRQIPIMILVAFAGYIVNYYSSLRFPTSPQIASTLGAFAVGALANLYSRFRHGVAAAILIPAIFTQVPGSLASQGGLLSGLEIANQIRKAGDSATAMAATATATATSVADTVATATVTVAPSLAPSTDSVVFGVAGSMIQIAIGITVGLFMSALVIYPLGKRRSGLFSF